MVGRFLKDFAVIHLGCVVVTFRPMHAASGGVIPIAGRSSLSLYSRPFLICRLSHFSMAAAGGREFRNGCIFAARTVLAIDAVRCVGGCAHVGIQPRGG